MKPTAEPRPRLWVVRHGQTEWSASGRHTSRTDLALTPDGEGQARRLRDRLRGHAFAVVLSSPRRRALETCRLAGFGDRVVVDDDLAEWDYGADEGCTTAEIDLDRPGWSIWRDGPEGGEAMEEVAARAERVIGRARAASGDVLAFGHGHQLRILAACWVAFPPADGRGLLLEPATISILGWERGSPVIERWNEPVLR